MVMLGNTVFLYATPIIKSKVLPMVFKLKPTDYIFKKEKDDAGIIPPASSHF